MIDQLQPGDVLVVDLFGKSEDGTLVGDNLFYYMMKTTIGGGLVVDGAIRDLEGIASMDMAAYFRGVASDADPRRHADGFQHSRAHRRRHSAARRHRLRRSGGHLLRAAVSSPRRADQADDTHIHDEWTKKKFDEGKYKSSDIYGSPREESLKKEYKEYLAKRLAEIKAER